MMECDVVVYNISESTAQEEIDEATWAFSGTFVSQRTKRKIFLLHLYQLCHFALQSALDAEMDNFESKKTFILISTLMTWAMTRPQDPVSLWETVIIFSKCFVNLKNPQKTTKLIMMSLSRIS